MKTQLFLSGAALLAVAIAGQVAAQNQLNGSQIQNAYVRYVAPGSVKTFPLPIVNFSREGLLSTTQKADIMKHLVYPAINRSRKPIGAIMIEAYPAAEKQIGFGVYWHDGSWDTRLIALGRNGKVPHNLIPSRPDVPEHVD